MYNENCQRKNVIMKFHEKIIAIDTHANENLRNLFK